MKWNKENGYVEYQISLKSIKDYLGINQFFFDTTRCEMAPYATYILKYINKRLLLLGEDSDIKQKIQEIFDIYDYGADKIVHNAALDLAFTIGISTDDIYIEGEEIPYNQDIFIFTWSNVLTSLYTQIKLQYSHLLYQPSDNECPCEYPKGQLTCDFESWTSGVYPEDENYCCKPGDGLVIDSWKVTQDIYPKCSGCYRDKTLNE